MKESARRSLPSVPLEPLLDRDPRELGAFRLLGRLGSGGMGVAYLADGQGQWAVVKVVRSELAEDAAFRARLSRELDAIGRLDGQSARVLESSLDSSTPWFAMEFIPGQTLDHVVRDRGPLNGPELSGFALSLARLLDGIHSAGIVHRDVKPSNVMMSPDGPRLIDFGIADVDEGTQLTRTGSVLGSLGWLSPEQVRGDATSMATDVHAWGLCAVFAATGAAPFGSDTSAGALYRVLETTPDVPTSMPEPLRVLVMHALAKEPMLRPSVGQIIATLAPAEASSPLRNVPDPDNAGTGSPSSARSRGSSPAGASEARHSGALPLPSRASVREDSRPISRRSMWLWTVAAGLAVLTILVVVTGASRTTGDARSAPALREGEVPVGSVSQDQVDEAAAIMRRGVAVVNNSSAELSLLPGEVDELTAQVAETGLSMFIAILPESVNGNGTVEDTLVRLKDAVGVEGIYAVLVGTSFRAGSTTASVADLATEAFRLESDKGPFAVLSRFVTLADARFNAPPRVCEQGEACAIGDTGPGGGVVFFDAGTRKQWGQYLEMAPAGWSKDLQYPEALWCDWNQPGYERSLQTGTGIGEGFSNTQVVRGACGNDSAAGLAAQYSGGGRNDWYLPSLDELGQLLEYSRSAGGGADGFSWSSSQYFGDVGGIYPEYLAWGNQGYKFKENEGLVRPIRAF